MSNLNFQELELTTNSAQQTQELGHALGTKLFSPGCLALSGNLGAGKTCLVQGVLRGLGVKQTYLTSPSYTIINQYESPKGLVYHCDLYRLSSTTQVEDLNLEENLEDGITLIEWPQSILYVLENYGFLYIQINTIGENDRRIKLVSNSKKYDGILQQISQTTIQEERK